MSSVQQAIARLDKLNVDATTASMREVLSRMRWEGVAPGQLPVGPISLQAELKRVLSPEDQVEFLHLNTWLIRPDFEVKDIITAVGGIAKFVVMWGIAPSSLLAELLKHVASEEVCRRLFPPGPTFCGVSFNVLYDSCMLVGKAGEAATWLLDRIAGGLVAVIDLLELPLDLVADAVLALLEGSNTHLFNLPGVAPQIPRRAQEIGNVVAEYDIASLCEVWEHSSRDTIVANTAFAGGTSEGHVSDGPLEPHDDTVKHLGAGLLLIAPRRPCTKVDERVYRVDGVHRWVEGVDLGYIVDIDRWSSKGVMLSRVPAGPGYLEIYTTHLYSGGDEIVGWLPGVGKVTDPEKNQIRLQQVDDLIDFIAQTHDPGAVAIVAGDFNIDGTDPGFTHDLKQRFANVPLRSGQHGATTAFEDWYAAPGFVMTGGPFNSQSAWARTGGTHRDGDENNGFAACTPHPGVAVPFHPRDYYCQDRSVAGLGSGRIDFVFIEQPQISHLIQVTPSRLRRRSFRRDSADTGSDGEEHTDWLSDHLGLECTLFVSRRP